MRALMALIFILGGCACDANDAYIGAEYLGAPYLNDPLGEGVPPDTDPLFRDDAFDCVTFVETVLAGGDAGKLIQIRYRDGDVDFVNRNHFMETDWLGNNSDLVENVSKLYGKTALRHIVIDKQNWFRVVHNIDVNVPVQVADLEYIPYENLGPIYPSEPMIVLFISGQDEKSDKIGTDLAVRHVGFLLPNGMLRHASSANGRVMDTDFYKYAMARAENPSNLGIVVVQIK